MNRINPIYILVLLFVILLVLFYKLDSAKAELKNNLESYAKTENVAIKLSSLKETYGDKQKIKKSLQKILKHSSLKSAGLNAKFKNSSLVIESKGIDKNNLNFLISKIVNSSFVVSSMKVRRISPSKAELFMEIRW